MPRYRTVTVPEYEHHIQFKAGEPNVAGLREYLRPGDRIVSVYPVANKMPATGAIMSRLNRVPVVLEALIELRHPSWANDDVGWDTEASE